MEACKPVVDQVDEDAVRVGQAIEGLGDPLGRALCVGGRALDEQDLDAGPGPLPFRRGRVDGRGDLVGGVAGARGRAEEVGYEALQGAGGASLGRAGRDARTRALARHHVARLSQPLVDRPDGVRVDVEDRAQLAHRRESRARVEPARVDLVRQLPVELGGDRDIRIPGDVQRAARRCRPGGCRRGCATR